METTHMPIKSGSFLGDGYKVATYPALNRHEINHKSQRLIELVLVGRI